MVKEIVGNIRNVKKGLIVHQVNCQNAMGSGVAKALYLKWPLVKQEYHALSSGKTPEELFGTLQYVSVSPTVTVANSFTQLTYGRYGKHTDETELIKNIRKACMETTEMVYIPYLIGCGLGGGNWEIIKSGIQDLENLTIVHLEQPRR